MIVYMLMNLIEERCYIGQTTGALSDRFDAHWESSKAGSSTFLAASLRKWDDPSFWEATVLQRVGSLDSLNAMETFWIDECSARDPAVGYNMKPGVPKKQQHDSPLAGLTPEQRRDFFRECGKKGAAASAGDVEPRSKPGSPLAGMSAEEKRAYFSECGKRGAGKPKRPRREAL